MRDGDSLTKSPTTNLYIFSGLMLFFSISDGALKYLLAFVGRSFKFSMQDEWRLIFFATAVVLLIIAFVADYFWKLKVLELKAKHLAAE